MQAYVSECRGLINQGEYNLPPVPQLKDFDVELQAYKEHVKEEIAQEAAAAGMTVEEYAANGYEPYTAQEQEAAYRLDNGDYLYIQTCESGYDYTFYREDFSEIDGGQLDNPDLSMLSARDEILALHERKDTAIEKLDVEAFEQAQEAAQTAEPQEPEKPEAQEKPQEPESPISEKADTPEQAESATKPLTDLQKKAVEIAKQYENLPLQDKIGIIAQSFGGTSGKIETSPCTGKWRGTSDVSIKFDSGATLFIGNHRTSQAKTAKVQNEDVNAALVRYNPEIIAATKEAAISALRKREAKDNEIAAQKGLKPYTLLNVEFNDGTDERSGGHIGWYYVTLAVDDKICSHIETGLNYDILDGKVSDTPTRENYFAAGALKETDVDYVFNNVGFPQPLTCIRCLSVMMCWNVRKNACTAERSTAGENRRATDPHGRAAGNSRYLLPDQRERRPPRKGSNQFFRLQARKRNGRIPPLCRRSRRACRKAEKARCPLFPCEDRRAA